MRFPVYDEYIVQYRVCLVNPSIFGDMDASRGTYSSRTRFRPPRKKTHTTTVAQWINTGTHRDFETT
jgi:hypothetical protein